MRSVYFFLLFLIVSSAASASPERAIQIGQDNLDAALPKLIGGAAAIIHNGKVVYQKTAGHEFDGGPAISAGTYFALGSVSKPLTAMVVADLIRAKKLSYDTAISSAVPQVAKEIQLRHVLSHTTGYTNYNGNYDIEKGFPREDILQKLLKYKPAAQPGEVFKYNNLVFTLIEPLVANISRQEWRATFKEGFKKRGLSHVMLDAPAAKMPLAHPHHGPLRSKKAIRVGRIPRYYPDAVCSAGGMYASLKDMIAFAKLQLTDDFTELHQPRATAPDLLAWDPKFPVPKEEVWSGYGYGWRMVKLKKDTTDRSLLVFHGGFLNGVSTLVAFSKTHNLALVILSNDDRSHFLSDVAFKMWGELIS